jgi:hypothetical protein
MTELGTRWFLALLLLVVCFAITPLANAQAQVASDGASKSQSDSQDRQAPPTSGEQQSQTNKPSLMTPLKQQIASEPYRPITGRQRLRWLMTNTLGPEHLAGGVITSAFGTALDRPQEDGTHWGGFAERFGVRLTGVATSNVMEAGLGAAWGEDPRYFREPDEPFRARIRSVIKQAFTARRRDGSFGPAYARFAATAGSNFLSNTWRPDSEANNHDAVLRTAEGFAGRTLSNAWAEFWPDVKARVSHRGH